MPFFTIILEGHRKKYCWRREGQVFFDYRSQISSGGSLNKKRTVPKIATKAYLGSVKHNKTNHLWMEQKQRNLCVCFQV